MSTSRTIDLSQRIALSLTMSTSRTIDLSQRIAANTAKQATLRFGQAHAFPVRGEVSFGELATASGLKRDEPSQTSSCHNGAVHLLRAAPGLGVHRAARRVLAENEWFHNWLQFSTDDLWHAAYHTFNAMAKYPGSREPHETGFALTDTTMFGFFLENPERLQYGLGEGGTVVDVGGPHGNISIDVARKFSCLLAVVQDLGEQVIQDAQQQRPANLEDRVEYAVHDFFTEQPVQGADVYFLLTVLHDWSNTYAAEFLRNLMPALKPGTKIILNKTLLPEPDRVSPAQTVRLQAKHLSMLELQNEGDREMVEWESLFTTAHPGFHFQAGNRAPARLDGFWWLNGKLTNYHYSNSTLAFLGAL